MNRVQKQSIVLLLGAFISVPGTKFAAAAAAFPSRSSVILEGTQAQMMAHQCSHAAPHDVTGIWSPSPAQITDLEQRLFPALQRQLGRTRHRPENYFRQYAGYIVGGRKIIYVNGVDRGYIDFLSQNHIPGADWEHEAVAVCDGGADFFGAEYDVETKTIRNLSFNGIA